MILFVSLNLFYLQFWQLRDYFFWLFQALDNTQSAADLKMQLDKINGRIEELQRLVKEKSSAVEQENHKFRRAQVRNTNDSQLSAVVWFPVYPLIIICCIFL